MGLSLNQEVQKACFVLFLLLYKAIVLWNFLTVLTVTTSRSLGSSMYFFLSCLPFVEILLLLYYNLQTHLRFAGWKEIHFSVGLHNTAFLYPLLWWHWDVPAHRDGLRPPCGHLWAPALHELHELVRVCSHGGMAWVGALCILLARSFQSSTRLSVAPVWWTTASGTCFPCSDTFLAGCWLLLMEGPCLWSASLSSWPSMWSSCSIQGCEALMDGERPSLPVGPMSPWLPCSLGPAPSSAWGLLLPCLWTRWWPCSMQQSLHFSTLPSATWEMPKWRRPWRGCGSGQWS